MNEQEHESELIRYYASQALADEKVDAILKRSESVRPSGAGRRLALPAACLALLVVGAASIWIKLGSTFNDESAQQNTAFKNSEPISKTPETTSPEDSNRSKGLVVTRSLPRYRFVAIRSHDDACPHCRATGEMFANLRDRMGDKPIEFEQLELQRRERLLQTRRRAQELQLTQMIEGKSETAYGLLLSEGGTKLIRFSPHEDLQQNETRLLDVLDQ